MTGHAFEDVDSQHDPTGWIRSLDRLSMEPFYREYKSVLRELMGVEVGGLYLDVGCGTGDDARQAAARGCSVVGLDHSKTMTTEARHRGLAKVVQADAAALPFHRGSFDGAWADRTFQHLPDPGKTLSEMIRVVRPDGRIATADPDYSTQSMNFPDRELARIVFQFRAFHAIRNGMLAHSMEEMFKEAGLVQVESRKLRLDVRSPVSVDNVLGLRSWASAARHHGVMTEDQVDQWERLYDEMASSGRFRWSVSFYLTAGSKPS